MIEFLKFILFYTKTLKFLSSKEEMGREVDYEVGEWSIRSSSAPRESAQGASGLDTLVGPPAWTSE